MPTINACSTLAFSLSSLEVALKHIRNYDFSSVEIADMFTHSKHFSIDNSDPEEVKKLLRKYSLTPVAANVSLAISIQEGLNFEKASVQTQSAAEIQEIKDAKANMGYHKLHDEAQADHYIARAKKLIKKAKIAGIPKVCLQGGRRTQILNINPEIKAAAKVIDHLAEFARLKGIKILLEMPHVWDIYYDIDTSKKMLDSLKSNNIGVLIDSTHWHVSGYDIDSYLDFLGDRLWHIHLRDAAGKDSSSGNYELEKTPGKGEVDFAKLAKSLDKHGYNGSVTLETEYKNYKNVEEVDVENRYALQYLKSVGWMTES